MLKRENIEKALYEMDVCFNGKADTYLVDALMYIDSNGGLPIKWTAMYYTVGKLRGASPAAVERGIRRLLSKLKASSDSQYLIEKYFGQGNGSVSESLGRFYTILCAESKSKEEKEANNLKNSTETIEVEVDSILRELHEINVSLSIIALRYKERWR